MKPFVIVVALFAAGLMAAEQNTPQPPRASVEIPEPKAGGQTIRVPAGGDLQKALDEAKAGDRIELQARTTYQGPFRLKAKEGTEWIVITSSAEPPKPGRHASSPQLRPVADGTLPPFSRWHRSGNLLEPREPGEFAGSHRQAGPRHRLRRGPAPRAWAGCFSWETETAGAP